MKWLPRSSLQVSCPVTFLVGENGTGKSTLLEAIAWSVGFGAQGGSRDQTFAESADGHALGRALRFGWRQKVSGVRRRGSGPVAALRRLPLLRFCSLASTAPAVEADAIVPMLGRSAGSSR
ncbi:MAG: AAA family ATPase [Steroidobacteraceae bacterium]